MKKCPCSNIDEMDIAILIDALEDQNIFYQRSNMNEFKRLYYPLLIDKLRKWKKEREESKIREWEGMKGARN